MQDDESMLLVLERRRCAAIAAGDAETLRSLLAENYVHVHMTGAMDDREGHIRAVIARPRSPERGNILVRVYGELAVLIGELTNRSPSLDDQPAKVVTAICQQVAVRTGPRWLLVSTQLTPSAAGLDAGWIGKITNSERR